MLLTIFGRSDQSFVRFRLSSQSLETCGIVSKLLLQLISVTFHDIIAVAGVTLLDVQFFFEFVECF